MHPILQLCWTNKLFRLMKYWADWIKGQKEFTMLSSAQKKSKGGVCECRKQLNRQACSWGQWAEQLWRARALSCFLSLHPGPSTYHILIWWNRRGKALDSYILLDFKAEVRESIRRRRSAHSQPSFFITETWARQCIHWAAGKTPDLMTMETKWDREKKVVTSTLNKVANPQSLYQ